MRIALFVLLLSIATPLASAQDRVLAHLPSERRAEMLSALRLELAARGTLLEDERPYQAGASLESMREAANARGATHVVWVRFPTGVLGPAELLVLDVTRSDAAHGMTPQAWDVVDPRVVAVLAGSLIDATSTAEPAPPAAEVLPESPTVVTRVEAAPAISDEPLVLSEPELDPRTARRFSLSAGFGGAHRSSPTSSTELESTAMHLTFYGRMSEWASIGLRAQLSAIGASSLEGFLITGAIGVPSILVSFREPLGTAAMLELGVHAEGGFYLYGRNVSEWSFGVSVGAVVNLELGAHQGISLDYTLAMFGFGDLGANAWGSFTLDYVARWD